MTPRCLDCFPPCWRLIRRETSDRMSIRRRCSVAWQYRSLLLRAFAEPGAREGVRSSSSVKRLGAPRGVDGQGRPRPARVLPRRRTALKSFCTRWEHACTAAGCPGAFPRHAPHRGAQAQPARCPRNRRHEEYRTQNLERLRPLRHPERRGLGGAARKLQALRATISGTTRKNQSSA